MQASKHAHNYKYKKNYKKKTFFNNVLRNYYNFNFLYIFNIILNVKTINMQYLMVERP